MKKSHIDVMPHILQAINSCGDDERMMPVKSFLVQAAEACQQVGKKRLRRENVLEKYVQVALTNNKTWWETIKKNIPAINPERIVFDEIEGNDSLPQ